MSLQPIWERICKGTHHLTDAGWAAWCEMTDSVDPSPHERLPDAFALEDRVLLNAAPVDAGAVLTVHAQTGQFADAPAEAQAAADMPQGSAAAPSLIADDLQISVNPEDRIVASYDLGGTPNPDGRNVGMGIADTGWEVFIENHIEPLLDAGVSRIQLLTPFGQRSILVDPATGATIRPPGQWGFQFDAYLDAQVEVPKLTEDFVSAFQDFFARHEGDEQLQEIYPYTGSPRLDADQLALVNDPDAWWDRAYDIITPILEAGFRSIGLDASATATPDTLDYELHNVLRYPELRDPVRDARLIEIVGDERVEVYLEAMPTRASGRTDFPVTVIDSHYAQQDPERPGPSFEFRQRTFFEHDRLTGEVVRIVRGEQWRNEGFLPVQEILLDGHTAAVSPLYFLRPSNGGAETLADYIAKMDLPSLPTHVDLDPEDFNPDTAVYEIIDGPDHGTLTPNRFHGDVFTYAPDPYFTGVDSFEYVVRDASGGFASAVVTFFVDTPVPHDGHAPVDPPAPLVLPPAVPPAGPVDGPPEPLGPQGPATPPVSGENPPSNPIDTVPPDSTGGTPPASAPPQTDTNGSPGPGGSDAIDPPSPPVEVPTPPSDAPATPGEDASVDAPVHPKEHVGSPPTAEKPPASSDKGASPTDATKPEPESPLDAVKDYAKDATPETSGSFAPLLSPELSEMLSLTDEEERGLFSGALSIDLIDAPHGPTVRVHYGFGVLQFLVSSMGDWLPPR